MPRANMKKMAGESLKAEQAVSCLLHEVKMVETKLQPTKQGLSLLIQVFCTI